MTLKFRSLENIPYRRKPSNKTDAFAEITIGNYGQQRYTAGVRTALIKNKLFFGAAIMYDKTDGCYTNEFNNSSFESNSIGFKDNDFLVASRTTHTPNGNK